MVYGIHGLKSIADRKIIWKKNAFILNKMFFGHCTSGQHKGIISNLKMTYVMTISLLIYGACGFRYQQLTDTITTTVLTTSAASALS